MKFQSNIKTSRRIFQTCFIDNASAGVYKLYFIQSGVDIMNKYNIIHK